MAEYIRGKAEALKKAPIKSNCCDLCGKEEKLYFDHDHKTLNPRGWLCVNCNQGLGKFFDSIELLQKSIQYLNKYLST